MIKYFSIYNIILLFSDLNMAIYLCPSDKKYTCSWEGSAEDILEHFQQEHDELLYFSDSFYIDLLTSSENRLFLIDEEIYLTQTQISERVLILKLRYLGPPKLALKISYNIMLKISEQVCPMQYINTTPEGSLTVDLQKLELDFPDLQTMKCILNITKAFDNNNSGGSSDSVFVDETVDVKDGLNDQSELNEANVPNEIDEINLPSEQEITSAPNELEETSTPSEISETSIPNTPSSAKKFIIEEQTEEDDPSSSEEKYEKSNRKASLSRSKTINVEELKRRNIRRAKSNLSLGPIQENDSAINCFQCGIILKPPIYVCPCGQNYCYECQAGVCRICEERVTYERNLELEEKYNKFLYPCKYKKLGCPQKLIYTDLYQHEVNCTFCEYKCPMEECHFEGQYKGLCKHLKLIHGSTKLLESFIVVFQNVSEAFLVNEERGIFYCYVKYEPESVLWEAKFAGPKDRSFFCELKFKDGKLKQPILLKKIDNLYSVRMHNNELKKMKIKAKNAIMTITG